MRRDAPGKQRETPLMDHGFGASLGFVSPLLQDYFP